MKKVYQKIITISLSVVLVLVGSVSSYASSGSPDPEEVTSWLAPDLDSVQSKFEAEYIYSELNSDIDNSVRAAVASYTIDDIYTLLYSAMRGQNDLSTYSLPQIASFLNRIHQILAGPGTSVPSAATSIAGRLSTMSSNLSSLLTNVREVHEILNGQTTGVYVRPSIQECLFRTDDQLNFIPIADDVESLLYSSQLIEAYINNLRSDLGSTNYYLNQINSSLSANFNWINSPVSNITIRTSIDGNPISGNVSGYKFFVSLNFDSNFDSYAPNVFRIFFPIERFSGTGSSDQSFIHISGLTVFTGGNRYKLNVPEHFIEQTSTGFYVYFFGLNPYGSDYYTFEISLDFDATYRFWTSVNAAYIPFDTDDYQLLYNTYSQKKNVKFTSKFDAAQEASQPVIDDTLSGFTGNGSAAANTSDTGGMKSMSGSIRSGLDAGGSVGNATSVFSTGSGFWGWFSVENSNAINSPYPAPVVTPFRSNDSGDTVLDFLSGNQAELQELLGGIK